MAVPVQNNRPEEVRTRAKIDVDPEHARSILERAFPKGRAASDAIEGRYPRRVSRIALIVGTVLLVVAAFVAGYVVRGSDSQSVTETTPEVVAPMTPRSPDAIDRAEVVAPMTPRSPDAIDRAPVFTPDMFGSPDAAERWLSG